MKFKTSLLIFIPLLLLLFSCSSSPTIKFESPKHDFGVVKQNQKLKHIFTFKNTGQKTLKIEKVKAT
ncbi:MAG: DUF1573 domain-containing protein [bacterium]|nr:DUF1573 domain-containing protein [bacterium]